MKRVLTAAVLVPVVLLAVYNAPWWLFDLLVVAIIILALYEYLAIAEAAGLKPFKWPAYVLAVAPIFLSMYWRWRGRDLPFESGFLLADNWGKVIALAAIIFGIPLVFRKDLKMGLASVASSLFGILYVGLSLSLLVSLRLDFSVDLIVFLLFSVWAGDIAAYYVGKSIGKHKLAPVVSPNKSWEGAIASVIGSIGVGLLIMHFRPQLFNFVEILEGVSKQHRELFSRLVGPVSPIHAVSLGILTNVAAQFGDLFESALKRGAGVKDSGKLLPGHGGILDRIDALLFAIPVVWYYATQTGLLLKIQE